MNARRPLPGPALAAALLLLGAFPARAASWDWNLGGFLGACIPGGAYLSSKLAELSAAEGAPVAGLAGPSGGLTAGIRFLPLPAGAEAWGLGICAETALGAAFPLYSGSSAAWVLSLPVLDAMAGLDGIYGLPAGQVLSAGPRAGIRLLPIGAWEGQAMGGSSGIQWMGPAMAAAFRIGGSASLTVPGALPARWGTLRLSFSGGYAFPGFSDPAGWSGGLDCMDFTLGAGLAFGASRSRGAE